MKKTPRIVEKALAVASFVVAAALAFLSLFLSARHEVASANLMAIAQFLVFAASMLGIDYSFNKLSEKL